MMMRLLKNVALVYADRVRGGDAVAGAGRDAFGTCRELARRRIDDVCRHLKASGFDVTLTARDALSSDISQFDWIVALGGDGTQLAAARYAGETPVLGLKMFPESSRGFLCSGDYDVFLAQEIAVGSLRETRARMRMNCRVNGVCIGDPFLNDALLSQANPARASRYRLRLGDVSEFQCSSGVWVSTAVGSHGALRSAGGPELDCAAATAAFCVRETATPGQLISGTFEPDDPGASDSADGARDHCSGGGFSIQVCGDNHRLYFDGGLWDFPLNSGDIAVFAKSRRRYRQMLLPGNATPQD